MKFQKKEKKEKQISENRRTFWGITDCVQSKKKKKKKIENLIKKKKKKIKKKKKKNKIENLIKKKKRKTKISSLLPLTVSL